MAPPELAHSQRYTDALCWASELHHGQWRKGKPIPYISHLIAVSALVWEDGGNENQAIAALLHDAIEDAGQSHGSIAARFGEEVAAIVADCTDTQGPQEPGAQKEPWLLRKNRFLAELGKKSDTSLLVTAADKAHNARDLVVDARRSPSSWTRFTGGLEGSAWYLLRIHQALSHRIPCSRSTALLGEAVQEILASDALRRLVPRGMAPAVWVAGYLERVDEPQDATSSSRAQISHEG